MTTSIQVYQNIVAANVAHLTGLGVTNAQAFVDWMAVEKNLLPMKDTQFVVDVLFENSFTAEGYRDLLGGTFNETDHIDHLNKWILFHCVDDTVSSNVKLVQDILEFAGTYLTPEDVLDEKSCTVS